MSKIPIGKYEDGSVKHCYFRRRKHNRTKRNGFGKIRHRMMIAGWIKQEAAYRFTPNIDLQHNSSL